MLDKNHNDLIKQVKSIDNNLSKEIQLLKKSIKNIDAKIKRIDDVLNNVLDVLQEIVIFIESSTDNEYEEEIEENYDWNPYDDNNFTYEENFDEYDNEDDE
jgi:hypothetical protein